MTYKQQKKHEKLQNILNLRSKILNNVYTTNEFK